MNNLKIEATQTIKDYNGNITITQNPTILNIEGHCVLNEIINGNHWELIINVKKKARLEYNRFCYHPRTGGRITINQEANTSCCFKEAVISNCPCYLDIVIPAHQSRIKNKIVMRLISENKAPMVLQVTAQAFAKITASEFWEDLKGLETEPGSLEINPNLMVGSNEVKAFHSATIGCLHPATVFYLATKGLTVFQAKELLKKSFIMQIYDEDFRNQIVSYLERNGNESD